MLMLTKRTPSSWNAVLDAVVKSVNLVPTPMTTSASRARAFAAVVPVEPTAAHLPGGDRAAGTPLPACASPTGMPVASQKRSQRLLGAGVAGRLHRRRPVVASAERITLGGSLDAEGFRASGLGDVPDPLVEETRRPVEGLGLDVLRERDRHRAGLHRVGEHAHRPQQGRRKLLGPDHLVEEPGERPEGVVDRDVAARAAAPAPGAPVTRRGWRRFRRQEQHGQAVDRREGGAGEHVRRPGADRGGADPGLEPVSLPGVGHRGVHHGLLVPGQDVGQAGLVAVVGGAHLLLEQSLAQARDVAVAEDAEASRRRARCRSPSRSVHWFARKRTVAWATVSRTVPDGVVIGVSSQAEVSGRGARRPRRPGPTRGPGRHRSARPAPARGRP